MLRRMKPDDACRLARQAKHIKDSYEMKAARIPTTSAGNLRALVIVVPWRSLSPSVVVDDLEEGW